MTFTATISGVMDLAGNVMAAPAVWSFSTAAGGFESNPYHAHRLGESHCARFARMVEIFVAEKSRTHKTFLRSLTDTSPVVFADLVTQVIDSGNRGLMGMALDPAFRSGRTSTCSTRMTRQSTAPHQPGVPQAYPLIRAPIRRVPDVS